MSLDTQILAIPRNAIPAAWLPAEDATVPAPADWKNFLRRAPLVFDTRRDLETNENYKQPIPYLLIQNAAGDFACYTRAGSEKRLRGLHSIGIGGHVEKTDTAAAALEKILHAALLRELSEETNLVLENAAAAPDLRFLGLINEEKTAVGRVHLGLVFLLKLGANDHLSPREELRAFRWLPRENLRALDCEHWTTLALKLLDTPLPNPLFGAIIGDIAGSHYEFLPARERCKSTDFDPFPPDATFTDDTILTVATADALLTGKSFADCYAHYGQQYPDASYGGRFIGWLQESGKHGAGAPPYNSLGNGSAMRVSPIGFAFDTLDATLDATRASAECTHNHPEGIKGAQATAAAIFWARTGHDKDFIRAELTRRFGYDLRRTVDEIRPHCRFDETCPVSVPEALCAFLDSRDYEDAIRLAISLGGDTDTQAAIAGSIAIAYYKTIPAEFLQEATARLDPRLLAVVNAFGEKFPLR
jgi:ADP-ribosylglycohydrolase/predicted NUDIX family phosphoesterase